MSSYAGEETFQETAEILTNLHIGQEMDAVHDFFDSTLDNVCATSQKDDSQLVGESDNIPERSKCSTKKVTINVTTKRKSKSSAAGAVKELMNCIAYQKRTDELKDNGETSPDFLSTDSSSDVTDVTPRSSTSGCSSLSRSEESKESRKKFPEHTHDSESKRRDIIEKEPVHTLRFLKEVLDSTKSETVNRSDGTTHKRKTVVYKNMTFHKEQIRKIDRENQILLRKIEENLNRRPKCRTSTPIRPRLSSSAVNRQRTQKRIDHDNLRLLKKIESVKSTINARVGVRKV